MLLAIASCQGGTTRENAEVLPPTIEVHDGRGAMVAELRPGHPCRATIGPVEMQIGGPPLVAQVGATRWSGDTGKNGTTLLRDGTPVARVQELGAQVYVFDPTGIPMVKISAAASGATVADASSRVVRHVERGPAKLAIDSPALTVTGTQDAKLAALLTARELSPELRMLAACGRVL
jgi:hypothetical protein